MRNFFLLSMVCMIIACSNGESQRQLDKFIPEDSLRGGVPSIDLKIEEQTAAPADGGYLLKGRALVPFDIRREQIKPTLLAAVKAMKKDDPKCQWMWVGLVPGRREMAELGGYVGIAEYRDGMLTLQYGIPSEQQIKEWNANIGKTVTALDISYVNDSPRLSLPDAKFFNDGYLVISTAHEIEKASGAAIPQEGLIKLTSKKLDLSPTKTKELYRFMCTYFSPTAWGNEPYLPR